MSYIEYCKQAESFKIDQIEFSESLIQALHSRFTTGTDNQSYRTGATETVETKHRIAVAADLPQLMSHYISQVTISSYSLHPIEVAAMAYKRFLDIYPFDKYNEETACAIASFLLQKSGYYFTGFPDSMRDAYYDAIEQAQKSGIPDELITLFAKSVCLS